MKIFSKFKDYYDNACPYVEDPIFNREEQSFILDKNVKTIFDIKTTEWLNKAWDDMPKPVIIEDSRGHEQYRQAKDICAVLGFCGKIYPIYLIIIPKPNGGYPDFISRDIIKPYTSVTDFTEAYQELKGQIISHKSHIFNERNFTESSLASWVLEFNHMTKLLEIFITIKSPIFLITHIYRDIKYRGNEFKINPNLSKLNIQRLFDPWTAYQELDMYLGNELVMAGKQMPVFSDELKRDAHGFDNKSFKQVGPKPRKQRMK